MLKGLKWLIVKNAFPKAKQLLNDKILYRFRKSPAKVIQNDVDTWFASTVGAKLLEQEKQSIEELLPQFFGYHLMQLSITSNTKLYEKSPISHCFSLLSEHQKFIHHNVNPAPAISYYEHLPIETESVDVVLLHHVLEYSPQPHLLLREATRTLIPNGHIILVGFNPFSLMGLIRPFMRFFSSSAKWHNQTFRVGRLKDWFKVLELDLIDYQSEDVGFFNKRKNNRLLGKMAKRFTSLYGSFYTLVLRKNVASVTMIQNQWRSKKNMGSWGKNVVASSVSESHSKSHNKLYD